MEEKMDLQKVGAAEKQHISDHILKQHKRTKIKVAVIRCQIQHLTNFSATQKRKKRGLGGRGGWSISV